MDLYYANCFASYNYANCFSSQNEVIMGRNSPTPLVMRGRNFFYNQTAPLFFRDKYSLTLSLWFLFCSQIVEFGKNICITWRQKRSIILWRHTHAELTGREAELHSRLYYKAHSWNLNIMRAEKSRYVLYFEEMVWRQYYLLFFIKKEKNASL